MNAIKSEIGSEYIVIDPYTGKKYRVVIQKMTAHLNNDQGCNFDNCEVYSEKEAIKWAIGRKGVLTVRRHFDDGFEEKSFEKYGKQYKSTGAEAKWF